MKPLQGLVAALALAAVAGCFYLIFEAGHRIYYSIGPSKVVAAVDGQLYIASHGFIHAFGPDGKRIAKLDLGEAGATRTPSDVAIHRDGRIVVANPDGSDIWRCSFTPPKCEPIDPKLTRVRLQKALPLNSVKVAIDDDRERYYFSDNAGHRVIVARFDGSRIAETPRFTVFYPNQLTLEGSELRVVDTNHRRLAVFDVSGDKLGPMKGVLLRAPDVARKDRQWPFDALRMANGEIWALLGDDAMSDADLIVFDAGGRARKRIDLGADSDPFDIALWHDRVFVADATRYRIDAVTPDGKVEAPAIDPEFLAEVRRASEGPRNWRSIRAAAQIGVFLAPFLAIFVLWRMGVPMVFGAPRPAPMQQAGQSLSAEVQWIDVDPRSFDASMRRNRLRALGVTVVLVALVAAFFFWIREITAGDPIFTDRLAWLAVILFAHLALVQFEAHLSRWLFKGYRIGASSKGFHYELARVQTPLVGSRKGHAPWRDVYFDGQRLLVGRKLLPVARSDVWMFDEDRLRGLVLANIPRANLLAPGKLMAKQAGPLAWILIAIILAILVPILFLL